MAFWMYSSGSTGRPKGVVHLQHDAAYTYETYGKNVLGIREADIVFSPPPVFFARGQRSIRNAFFGVGQRVASSMWFGDRRRPGLYGTPAHLSLQSHRETD